MSSSLNSQMLSLNASEGGPGTACYFPSNLVYAFPDNSHDMSIFVDDLSAFSQVHTPAALNHWRGTQLKTLFPSNAASSPSSLQSNMVPASVGFDGYYYLFWIDTNGNLRGMRSAPDLSNAALIKFSGKAGKDQPAMFTSLGFGQVNLSACVTPDGKSIAVQFLTSAPTTVGAIHAGSTIAATFLFDPAKFNAFQDWTGVYNIAVLPDSTIWGAGYVKGSFAWFTQADTSGNATHYQVMTAFSPTGNAFKTKIWQVGAGLNATDAAGMLSTADIVSVHEQPFILRDPDGAVRLYYSNGNSALETGFLLPNSIDDAPGLNAPLWSGLVQCANGSQAYPCQHGPTAVFVTLPVVTGNSPCHLPEPVTPPASKTYKDCLLQHQMVILFSAQTNIWYATRFYGTLIGVLDYVTTQPNPDFVKTMLLSMVADTFPYPPPSPALWDDSSPSGMVDWTAATYEYMVGNQTATDVSYESNSAIGVKLGLDSSEGVALKADVSLADGTTAMLQQTKVVTRANGLDVSTKGIPNPDTTKPFLIAPQGALFGRSYPNLTQDVFVFADETNTLRITTAVPSTVRLRVDTTAPPVAIGGQFTTYCYTPGALASYEESALDLTMKNKFNALSPTAKQDFVIDGKNYAGVYTNGKYLENIVKLFGAKCFGSTGDLSYLEYSFSQSGSQKTEYQDTSSFTEAGGTYLDTSDYLGTAGGIGFDFYGIGETQSFYAEAGVEMHYSLTSGTTAGSSWGLQLQGFLNPLASGEAYSVRMYFLRPSLLWAAEVKNFSGDNSSVDFGSSMPVRILFTVPYISTTLAGRLAGS